MAIKYGKKYKKHFEEAKKKDSYWVNMITLQFATSLWEKMQKNNIKRSELAKIIGKSPAYITKVLRGDANYTVETLYKLSKAVGCKLDIKINEEKADVKPWETNERLSLITMNVSKKHPMGEAANTNHWSDANIKVA